MTAPPLARAGVGGLPLVSLRAADGAAADVYSHGAHVTSWRPAPDMDERLFLSARSEFRAGAAIRGGIPVIFPQFAAEGPLPRHGFARTAEWQLESVRRTAEGDAIAELSLQHSPETRAIWDAEFRATLSLRVGGPRLDIGLGVENVGRAPFSFTCALHTYLRVRDVAHTEILGLQGARYRVSGAPATLLSDGAPALRVAGELDRVYVDAPHAVLVREPHRTLRVEMRGFRDAVIWNPGPERAAALADMEPDGERAMLCVEAAVAQRPVTLAAGDRWDGAQSLDAAPSGGEERGR